MNMNIFSKNLILNYNLLLLKYCIIKEKSKDNRAKSLFFQDYLILINNIFEKEDYPQEYILLFFKILKI